MYKVRTYKGTSSVEIADGPMPETIYASGAGKPDNCVCNQVMSVMMHELLPEYVQESIAVLDTFVYGKSFGTCGAAVIHLLPGIGGVVENENPVERHWRHGKLRPIRLRYPEKYQRTYYILSEKERIRIPSYARGMLVDHLYDDTRKES